MDLIKAIVKLGILLVLCFCKLGYSYEPTKVLVVVGPSNHPPGSHEVAASGRLMQYCLENISNLPNVAAEIVYEWPQDKSKLSSASTIVFVGDTFPPQRFPDTQAILAQLDEVMARGCGIVCVHYATGLWGQDVEEDGAHPLLGWLGGYFANNTCPHHQGTARIFPAATIRPATPEHPISQGWSEFTLDDEPYINNYFGGADNQMAANVTALATSMLPPETPKLETVAWCVERGDGGRGFAIVMPHFYKNWALDDLRRFILNGVVWTAKREVPAGGVQTELPDLQSFSPASVEVLKPAELVKRVIHACGGRENILSRFSIQESLNVSDNLNKVGNIRESVIDGREGWWCRTEDGQWHKPQDDSTPGIAWAMALQAIGDKKSKVRILPEITDNDHRLIGLRIAETITPAMDVYFDIKTMQLARIDWRKDFYRFTDWRSVFGSVVPFKCVGYRKESQKPWFFSEIVDVKRLDVLPDNLVSP